ncbi:protoheme IX farnesyltransferase [Coprinopsis sp. MPI-PUGE-AT-0042]|nr:protoheme IX farnesyltransferase [Coprinopsis sp. MPI-PUGE-AT-0042]
MQRTLLLRGCRRLGGIRSLSSNSFFLHNTQWLPPGYENTKFRPASLQRNVHPALTTASPPLSAYKPVEDFTPKKLLKIYSQLSKTRLTVLVMLTSMSAVALSPLPTTVPVLLSTALGTALCSASANSLNQLQEVPFDAQMARTRSRPLVRRAISPLHASLFAATTGLAGPALLWVMVNPTTAILGAANIALYAGAYTFMKRRSIWNTWVGSVVGAIPPLMGWTACGGHILPSVDYPIHIFLPSFLSNAPVDVALVDNPLSAFALFMLLYSWQFPHFNTLSYLVRDCYAQAGYTMLSVLNPAKNAAVSLRHAALLIPICSVLFPLSGLVTWTFALTSLVPNLIWLRAAWRFWKQGGEKNARSAFHHSLWYLPVVMGLMMVHKQGMDWLQWIGIVDAEEKDKEEQQSSS